MKELLKHYKEVKEKANPEKWVPVPAKRVGKNTFSFPNDAQSLKESIFKSDGVDIDDLTIDGYTCEQKFDEEVNDRLLAYQREQLELEQLLHWHWERNVLSKDDWNITGSSSYIAKELCEMNLRVTLLNRFNKWLQQQLDKL